jgi:hypothetical protein
LFAGVVLWVFFGIAALIASYLMFSDLGGRAIGWGAVTTLLGSSVLIQFSASAMTTDPSATGTEQVELLHDCPA